ncbi:uncharacterized protein [Amphiura filiformis]|uniref:uncharacterized protein n=1 Tax=Amphiura filiformis TaxID=82378 RepID=UPI003B21CFD6
MDIFKAPSLKNDSGTSSTSSPGEANMVDDQVQERNDSHSSAAEGSSNTIEPQTGDFIMESRIPEESATTSTTSYNTSSTEDSSIVHHQPYTPTPAKRQRTSAEFTSREKINEKAQQLIDEINNKRKEDTVLLADFKKSMEMQVARSYGLLEQSMYQVYDHNGKIMQAKLQELFATLDRIAKLEAELKQFKNALGALYTDIN